MPTDREPKPVAFMRHPSAVNQGWDELSFKRAFDDDTPLYTAPPRRKEEQEPFAEVRLNMTGGNAGLSARIVQLAEGYYPAGTKLYLAPPRKEWQSLTDEEIDEICETQVWDARRSYARAIEAKLREKNGNL